MFCNCLCSLALSVFAALPFLGLAAAEGTPEAPPMPENKADWVKVQTTDVPMRDEKQVLTPGLFDRAQMRLINFPVDGKPVDLELPHDGKDKDGKPLPPLMGVYKAGFVWLDLNGNGKQDPRESGPVPSKGAAGPFVWQATYEDGTSGPYTFKLLDVGESGKLALVRMSMKQAKVGKNTQLLLLDDDGNGKYGDLFKDALILAGQPVNLLSRQVYIEGKLHELLVHPAGQTIELRPMEAIPLGAFNLFTSYKPPQKAENLKLHTLIVAGKDGSFAFDRTIQQLELPAGAYDLVFGLFERANETVVLRKGERTSFNVEAGKVATLAWGGPVEARFDLQSDGTAITVGTPTFFGLAGEIYQPLDFKTVNVRASLAMIWLDKRLNNRENFEPSGTKKYEVLDNNDLKPVVFEWMKDDEMQVAVSYQSGILGSVDTKQRIQFVKRRK